MLSEAYQRVATLQLGSNCCSVIAIFTALSFATLKCERAFSRTVYSLKQWIVLTQISPISYKSGSLRPNFLGNKSD